MTRHYANGGTTLFSGYIFQNQGEGGISKEFGVCVTFSPHLISNGSHIQLVLSDACSHHGNMAQKVAKIYSD